MPVRNGRGRGPTRPKFTCRGGPALRRKIRIDGTISSAVLPSSAVTCDSPTAVHCACRLLADVFGRVHFVKPPNDGVAPVCPANCLLQPLGLLLQDPAPRS